MSVRCILVASLALVLSWAGVWWFTSPGGQTFHLSAREVTFERLPDGRDYSLQSLVEPSKVREVVITRVSAVGNEAENPPKECVLPATSQPSLVVPDPSAQLAVASQGPLVAPLAPAGRFSLVKPLAPQVSNCTTTLRLGVPSPELNLGFHASCGGKAFAVELGLPAESPPTGLVAPSGAGARFSEMSCRAQPHQGGSAKSFVFKSDGWVRVHSVAQSMVVWDNDVPVRKLEVVLSQPDTVGFGGESCTGGLGDLLIAEASAITIHQVSAEPQRLSLRFSTAADWRFQMGGCEISAREKHLKQTMSLWLTGFITLSGSALFGALATYVIRPRGSARRSRRAAGDERG